MAAEPATNLSGQAREGMEVVGSDGERVGLVKEVRVGDLLMDRPTRRDLYVPLDAVREVTGGRVVLTGGAGEADDQGWPNPPLPSLSGPCAAGRARRAECGDGAGRVGGGGDR